MMAKTHPPKTGCFGYRPAEKRCKVFTELLCVTKGRCSRYRTPRQFREAEEAASARAIAMGYYARKDTYEPITAKTNDPASS